LKSKGKIIALLIGRKGSKRLRNKNLLKIVGRHIMEYPILAALNSKYIDACYVSTDDEKIKEIAENYGFKWIERPEELATDEALAKDVYIHAYNLIRGEIGEVKYIVLLSCNAPTLMAHHIDEAIEKLEKNPEYDSAATISIYNMWSPLRAWKLVDDKLKPYIPEHLYEEVFGNRMLSSDRASAGNTYFIDASLFVIKPENLENIEKGLLPYPWLGRNIIPVENWGGCDLDVHWQVPVIEYWLRQHGFTEYVTPYELERMEEK
jgi:CMP-N-acetylneuraminic acid synthetase